jgi:hypothetical protein
MRSAIVLFFFLFMSILTLSGLARVEIGVETDP